MKQYTFAFFAILFFTQVGCTKSTGTFTDPRDGQTYKTFSFKNPLTGATVTWMGQNLDYKMQGSYAYDGNDSNRKELGLLYTWDAAKKACPKGWHLATDSEWSMLVTEFGGTDKAGAALKSTEGWDENGDGTNSSGFNGFPGGMRKLDDSRNIFVGSLGYWWTSTPTGREGKAWEWNMHYGGSDQKNRSKVFPFDGNVSNGHSVRCVRD